MTNAPPPLATLMTLLLVTSPLIALGQNQPLSLRERLQPVARASGFRMEGYFVWCGSAIKVGASYHLFASRWPVATKFPDGYRTHSEIVRATSARPEGPYQFQEVVIGKRETRYWDSGMAHNPAIYRHGGGFVLYYIASPEGSRERRIGVAAAPAVTGPWARSDQPLDLGIESDANNPAAYFEPDGRTRLMWRNRELRVYISEADSFRGPYRLVNDNVWPQARLEDFFLLKHERRYHLICEDARASVTGHTKWGGHLTSRDGIHDWQRHDPATVYDHIVHWTDGTSLQVVRRERPWLLIEDGAATHLFTSIFDGTATWNQPVPLRPAWRIRP